MILDTIKTDLVSYRKTHRDTAFLATLIAEIQAVGKNAGNRETTDNEALGVLKKFKEHNQETQRLMANTVMQNGVRLQEEIDYIDKFLPKQMTSSELQSAIYVYININNSAKIGDIMKYLKENYAGQYDGKLASSIAKEILGKIHK